MTNIPTQHDDVKCKLRSDLQAEMDSSGVNFNQLKQFLERMNFLKSTPTAKSLEDFTDSECRVMLNACPALTDEIKAQNL